MKVPEPDAALIRTNLKLKSFESQDDCHDLL